jgi:hypothetical protein
MTKKDYYRDVLLVAHGEKVTIKLDDEIFGTLKVTFENYDYEINDEKITFKSLNDLYRIETFNIKEILSLEIATTKENILKAIEECEYLTTISSFVIESDPEIDSAIKKKSQIIFKRDLTRYELAIQREIQDYIKHFGYNLSAESIFKEMVVNILNKTKIENWGDLVDFIRGSNKRPELIEKLIKLKNEREEVF